MKKIKKKLILFLLLMIFLFPYKTKAVTVTCSKINDSVTQYQEIEEELNNLDCTTTTDEDVVKACNSYNTEKGPSDFVSFGAMVRDDIYINKGSGELLGDYVSAGILFNSSHTTGANTFARRNGRLIFEGGDLKAAPNEGDELSFCIETTGDGYRASIEGYSPVSTGYDFKLTAIDPDHIYVGFYSSRSVAVTVSDIVLERS